MNNKTKAQIKDLELQIDYLTGYKPSGLHWKQEYYLRKSLIESIVNSDNTPPEIVDKIAGIQDAIYRLRNHIGHGQDYVTETWEDYKISHPIKVRHNTPDGLKEWYI